MLEAASAARQAEFKAHRASYFPDLVLALRASHSYSPGTTDQTNPFISDAANLSRFEAGLVARWSLDVLGNRQRVRRSESMLRELEAQRSLATKGIRFEVESAYETTVAQGKVDAAWRDGERETRAWFVAAAQGFQLGTVEAKDLVEAVKAYFGARSKHIEATQSYNVAVAELVRVSDERLLSAEDWRTSCSEDTN